MLIPHFAKPLRHGGIIDPVPLAHGQEALLLPQAVWGLCGVLLLQVFDPLLREEILLEDIDHGIVPFSDQEGGAS